MSAASEVLPYFFLHNSLAASDIQACLLFAAEHFPNHLIQPVAQQGGCSYTLVAERQAGQQTVCSLPDATDDEAELHKKTIIQFRLLKHALPIRTARAASRLYIPLAPKTRELGHITVSNAISSQVCVMQFIPGERFSEVQPQKPSLSPTILELYGVFMTSLGTFFATSWSTGQSYTNPLQACTGKIGSTLLSRLATLSQRLPSRALRERARETLVAGESGVLNSLPVSLTHGDLLPHNILVDPQTWRVEGIIDWAEAEDLPHGINLYALEHLLGYLDVRSARRPRFVYYAEAAQLRNVFWTAFRQQVPGCAWSSREVQTAMGVARDVGCLLWHGFAWDNGSVDRVINTVDDGEELACLEAFLGLEAKGGARHDSVVEMKV
ncbi:hypothetical protein LTR08_006437 [Meristemomyces frigidus]|nr:hypothetical protein LTR08_006437 [Meristemomyces frigidus]